MVPLVSGLMTVVEGQWTIVDSRSHGNITPVSGYQCTLTQVGIYEITVPSQGTLKFCLVKDPCSSRQAKYCPYGVPVTLVQVLEFGSLMGSWMPLSGGGQGVHFREDLQYRWQEEAAGSEAGMKGWFDITGGQLSLTDMLSQCSITDVGTYRALVSTEGQLTLDLVEDECAERRAALTGSEPYKQAETALEVAGWWIPEDKSNYLLQLASGGTFSLFDNGNLREGPLREGTLNVTDAELELVDLHGQAPCEETPGTYAYRANDGKLALVPSSDRCSDREALFRAHDVWVPTE